MVRVVSLALVLWSVPTLSAAQWISGEGLVLYYERGVQAGQPRWQFRIHRPNRATADIVFSIESDAESVESVRIHNPTTASVLLPAPGATHRLWIVDLESGEILFHSACQSARLTRDSKYYRCERTDTDFLMYDLAAHISKRGTTLANGVKELLESGSLPARRRFLQTFNGSEALRQNRTVGSLIRKALENELAIDIARANEQTPSNGLRQGSLRTDYFGDLVRSAAYTNDTECLKSIVRADHPNVAGALAWFGPASVAPALAALNADIPKGYSKYYRSYLLRGISLAIERAGVVPERDRTAVQAAVIASLSKPATGDELVTAIDLAGQLDDETLDPLLNRLVDDRTVLERAGVAEPEKIAQIRNKARFVLDSRIIIP